MDRSTCTWTETQLPGGRTQKGANHPMMSQSGKRTGNADRIRNLLAKQADLSSKIEKQAAAKTDEKRADHSRPVPSSVSQPTSQPTIQSEPRPEDRLPPPYSDRQLSFVRRAAGIRLAHGQPLDDLAEFAADLGIALDAWHPDYFTFGKRGSSSSRQATIQPKIEPETCLCCESVIYWRDRNGTTHCARCRKPPQPSFVESIWVVRCQIDDSGERQNWWEKGSEDDAPGGKSGWKWLESAGKRVRYELGMIEDAESLDVGS